MHVGIVNNQVLHHVLSVVSSIVGFTVKVDVCAVFVAVFDVYSRQQQRMIVKVVLENISSMYLFGGYLFHFCSYVKKISLVLYLLRFLFTPSLFEPSMFSTELACSTKFVGFLGALLRQTLVP
jgi:hypothetical protein